MNNVKKFTNFILTVIYLKNNDAYTPVVAVDIPIYDWRLEHV